MSVRMYLTAAANAPITETNENTRTPFTEKDTHLGHRALRLVEAYEDGRVEQWECKDWQTRTDPRLRSSNGVPKPGGQWRNLWTLKGHNEASKFSLRIRLCVSGSQKEAG